MPFEGFYGLCAYGSFCPFFYNSIFVKSKSIIKMVRFIFAYENVIVEILNCITFF